MNYEPLPLKEIKQTQARLFNLMLCHNNEDQTISEGGDSTTFQLKRDAIVGSQTEYVVLSGTLGPEDLTLAISSDDLLEWINPQFYVIDFSTLPEEVVLVICEKGLSFFWEWLQGACSEKLLLKTWNLKKGKAFLGEGEQCFSLRFSFPSGGGSSPVGASKRFVECLFPDISSKKTEQLIRRFPLRKPEENSLRHLLWPVRISMGFSWLKASTVIRVQRGDIVFFQRVPRENCLFVRITPLLQFVCKVTQSNTVTITGEGRILMSGDDDLIDSDDDWTEELDDIVNQKDDEAGAEEEDLLGEDFLKTLESENTESEAEVIDDDDTAKRAAPPTPKKQIAAQQKQKIAVKTKDISVLLNFDVGSTTLSLDQLQSIKQGYCFELINDFNDYITLRAHDQIIARGELVKVGGHLGVEITQMGSKMKN